MRSRIDKYPDEVIDPLGMLHFILVHVACLAVFFVGVSQFAIWTCVILAIVRMFAITGGYHRYFSHRSYKTNRVFQFLIALIGTAAAQMGPLWWAAHHRHHHKYSDTKDDQHSPITKGFFWAHMGWIMCKRNYATYDREVIKDFEAYPELRWLTKYALIVPFVLAMALFAYGHHLDIRAPQLGTNGIQMVIWGFFVSTVILYHCTFLINSTTHLIGTKRYETGDDSKNHWLLAILTMGEGWHNNHHRYPSSERQGIFWWEVDMTHYILKILSWFGVVSDLRVPPKEAYDKK